MLTKLKVDYTKKVLLLFHNINPEQLADRISQMMSYFKEVLGKFL